MTAQLFPFKKTGSIVVTHPDAVVSLDASMKTTVFQESSTSKETARLYQIQVCQITSAVLATVLIPPRLVSFVIRK